VKQGATDAPGRLAQVNDTSLYYERAGAGETLVLVHGGGGDRRYWDGQFAEMARDFDVVRYDLRGYGKSSAAVEGQPYRHEDDLAGLLDSLGIDQAHIAGFSLGCQIVVDTYTVYPERFRSLIAVGPYVSGHVSAAATRLFDEYGQCGAAFAESGSRGAAERFVNMPAFNPERIDPAVRERILAIASDHSWWWANHHDPMQTVVPVATEKLADLAVPVLIVSAQYDVDVCREVADLLEANTATGVRVDIPGASHFMLMENPVEFNRALRGFLRGD
jgi:pimeloyl-ACP methyl ester carboxylesterase